MLSREHAQHTEKKMDTCVCLPTTMRRILKERSGLKRIERAAALTACEAADRWLHSVVDNVMLLTNENGEKTISAETVAFVTQSEDVEPRSWPFCKTRLRDAIKSRSPNFRWSLAAKVVLCNAFDDYLNLLACRIAATQELAGRRTISEKHVKADVNCR